LLRPSPDADASTGLRSAWPLAADEWPQGAVNGLIPEPTSQTSLALQAMMLREVPKPTAKKPGGKDGAKKAKTGEEELLSSLCLWFAVGSLIMSSVLCCCVPVIDLMRAQESMTFNLLVDLAIVASVIFIALDFANPDKEEHLSIVQHCFTAFFLGEVVLRIRALGVAFFTNFWGIFDFTLVFAAAIDFWILPIALVFIKDSPLETLTEYAWLPYFMRSLRLHRLLRVFRLFRPESFYQQHKEENALDNLAEVWVRIPKDGGKTGRSRSKGRTLAAP